ncbi:Protein of unknown function [Bacillus cereus]|nr:Protein of unknown function [Bacillus cereus]SCN35368.1 Protein of unknown function [Bacillus wiedmannii]
MKYMHRNVVVMLTIFYLLLLVLTEKE